MPEDTRNEEQRIEPGRGREPEAVAAPPPRKPADPPKAPPQPRRQSTVKDARTKDEIRAEGEIKAQLEAEKKPSSPLPAPGQWAEGGMVFDQGGGGAKALTEESGTPTVPESIDDFKASLKKADPKDFDSMAEAEISRFRGAYDGVTWQRVIHHRERCEQLVAEERKRRHA